MILKLCLTFIMHFQCFFHFISPWLSAKHPMSPDIFVVNLLFEKRRESLSSSFFELWQQQKSLADIWCLVFSYQLMQPNRFNFPNRRTKKFIAILCITLLSIDHIVWIYTYIFVPPCSHPPHLHYFMLFHGIPCYFWYILLCKKLFVIKLGARNLKMSSYVWQNIVL